MLKGIIEPASMAGVLRLLDDVGATGRLRLDSPGGVWTVAFWQGRVTGVQTPEALVPAGDDSRREHVVASVAEVLELSEGSFSWIAERITAPEGMDVLEVRELLGAALALNEELQRLRRIIPSPECVAHIVADQGDERELRITSDRWRVLAVVDGRRTVGEIVRASGRSNFEALSRLAELIDDGLVALAPRLEGSAGEEVRPAPAAAPAPDFEIVTICNGNRFRSPLAEAFIREQLAGLPVRVRSLGLQDLGPAPVLPEAQAQAEEMGVDLSEHRARALEGEDLSAADLVVVFERTHLARAVVDAKAPFRSTFLMVELVDLLEQLDELPAELGPINRARAALEEIQQRRAPTTSPSARGELVDPLGGPAGGYRATAERLRDLSSRLVAALFGKVASESVRD